MGKVSTRSFNSFQYCSNSSYDALILCYIYLFTIQLEYNFILIINNYEK